MVGGGGRPQGDMGRGRKVAVLVGDPMGSPSGPSMQSRYWYQTTATRTPKEYTTQLPESMPRRI